MTLLRPRPLRPLSRLSLLAAFALSAFTAASAQSNPTVLINYPAGFTGVTGLQTNGSATFNNGAVELTSGGQFQAGSVFTTTRMQSTYYTTDFDFQITDAQADGFAFVLQAAGPDALGSNGGGVGYGNPPGAAGAYIPASVAVVFDLHNNQGEGSNSVRLERNGVTSTTIPSYDGQIVFDLTPFGLDLHSGHIFHVEIASYVTSGAPGVFITDLATGTKAALNFPVLTPVNGSGVGYIGFTGATGATTATTKILNWTYTAYNPVAYGGGIIVPVPDISFPDGFAGATSLIFNGGAALSGSAIQLTKGTKFAATSAFSTKMIEAGYNGFDTDFDFNLGDGSGDGFAFVVQDEGPSALGSPGGGLGYGPDQPGLDVHRIKYSQAIKFDLHNNAGEGVNSTGFYLNGASPTTPSIDLTPSGLNLHTNHTYHANLSFRYYSPNGAPTPFSSYVIITITDLTVYKVFYKTIPIDSRDLEIGEFDYVGFTAGTGATPSSIQILNWRVLSRKG